MIIFEVDDSDLQRILAAWPKVQEQFLAALYRANVLASARLLGYVKGSLRDGSVGLRYHTGKLSRNWSIKKPVMDADGKGWVGGIGTNTVYAAYHEFGFSGIEHVRAHTRRSARARRASAWGPRGRDVFARRRSDAVAQVRAHDRRVNYAGHPYVRPAVRTLTPEIREIHAAETAKVNLNG